MRIFKNKAFRRWADEIRLSDASLSKAVNEMVYGLYDASLGGNVYKKRVPLGHRGKSGGARTIVVFKLYDKVIFIYGFSKNDRANITKKEEALKALAKAYFSYSDHQISQAVKPGELVEVKYEKINS